MADESSYDAVTSLPRPFYDEGTLGSSWPRRLRPAAHALWHWHMALANPQPIGVDGTKEAIEAFCK